ncbi:PREDICTED: omega-hydroxypalmitate O-feruloyl transferase-like isoform X2 [Camelina sativa]|uniref:Omega-hydroxypalmitate O-feruloyl transferase-like isoform X1 n=1 Tax=Camelina sativa TaxID=90675 RepID=A0ABM0Z7B9_CAMSA|nr:PREDICTED: omega-hydroxypalmitate O-feruloyl transferase-like isoform X1 [Camelina sativa]XP_019101566.1 PREDICTED: omega-hydroxypalmitate O-feruloyl transferase-like isoform X2 [Camelina sativa]
MGSLYQESPPLLLQDLKVTINESTLIFPSDETSERKSMFLSNVDQILNFDVQTVHFFRSNKDFPPEMVSEKLRRALVKAMDAYEFLAGRLRVDPSSGRLDVDCNGAGAGFVTGESEYTLEELGDLVYPNPAFAQLVTSQLKSLRKDDQPLFAFQMTSFKCGGFAMGISTNHTTFDGLSFKTFLENLASLLSEKPLSTPPCNDRTLLKARTPPSVTFPHHELVKFQDCETTTVFEATSQHLDFKIFKLSSDQINKLKERASETSSGYVRVSGFNVVTALVWRCKALSVTSEKEEEEANLERESTILYAVDIRGRLNPELPPSYTGNAVLTAYAKAKCKALLEEPFGRIVEIVGEGAKRITDEYARSAIDWGELYKGFPHGEVLVSSWWKLGFAEVEYPWGKPKYSCPVVYHRKDIVLLFPDIDGDSKGVYVLAALPSKEMTKFQHWFEDTLC